MADNYADAIGQLADAGLIIDRDIQFGRIQRWRVEGDKSRERRAWTMLREWRAPDGATLIVGSYGIAQGADPNAVRGKIEIKGREFSKEERAAFAKMMREQRAAADRASKAEAARAAKRAEAVWLRCSETGEHDYLARKGVQGFGVRYSPQGALVIPMLDPVGRVHGLQFVLSRKAHAKRIERTGRDKEFWPRGLAKRGHFHQIGRIGPIALVCEGYATGASLHMATGLPVVVAFDAGNLQPAVEALSKRHRSTRWLFCADDDAFTDGNPGVSKASNAAVSLGGEVLIPRFADEEARQAAHAANGRKITDFNDLHLAEGLHTVRAQAEARLRELDWREEQNDPRAESNGGEGSDALCPIDSYEEMIDRFALIYGHSGTVFDFDEHMLLALSDMRDACTQREFARRWQESPSRRIYRVSEVGFDPGGTDPAIKCNLWAGWPTAPAAGSCERLLELLRFMCGHEAAIADDIYRWVLCWLAYPIQNPGAKMRSTVIVQGPQGTGKNLFFESIMQIYGPYGRIIDQSAIEDKFNDWASRKLFMIADEVVARSDLYHVKNKLKGLITGTRIRINPKNVGAYEEANHVNMVFLSNEVLPAVIEEDDRRHLVIWTPPKLSPQFYAEVGEEIANGGIAALHQHLLEVDLSGFGEHSKPPMTQAKADLIEISRDNVSRFWRDWVESRWTTKDGNVLSGEIPGVPVCAALSEDVYALYRAWCARTGVKQPAQMATVIGVLAKKPGASKDRARYQSGGIAHNPAMYLLPPGMRDCPEGESRSAWLGQQFDAFKCAVKDYRAGDQGIGYAA